MDRKCDLYRGLRYDAWANQHILLHSLVSSIRYLYCNSSFQTWWSFINTKWVYAAKDSFLWIINWQHFSQERDFYNLAGNFFLLFYGKNSLIRICCNHCKWKLNFMLHKFQAISTMQKFKLWEFQILQVSSWWLIFNSISFANFSVLSWF